MAVIRVLDKHTAELIAAGEVVERPASVVKELLENSIDAGATQITVAIESGGVKLIEVSDNGSGIEPEDIPTAFIRHATSKIQTGEDLNAIHTLGFRGEALASIASVARVELLTRTETAEFACLYRIEGGEEQPLQPDARGVGTTIRVRDLFYNTPARMKFLKKDSSEGTFVADVVSHLALSHPEIRFKFVREGKTQYVTPGDGKLRSAVYAVLGREFSRDLLDVGDSTLGYRVYGLVTPPRCCRASRSMQYFYINGRYVRNRTMMAALETAFKGVAMQGKFPGGVLLLEMPADLVDVNVHPAKTEVRFARENDVFDIVYHAVKLALTQPGSGEQRFVLSPEAPKEKEGEKAAKEAEFSKNSENKRENSVKRSNFTGLSAIIQGQSEPGTLKKSEKYIDFTEIEPSKPAQQPAKASFQEDWEKDLLPLDPPETHQPAPKKPLSQPSPALDGIDRRSFQEVLRSSPPPSPVVVLHSPPPASKKTFRRAEDESRLDISPALETEEAPVQDSLSAWQTPAVPEAAPAEPEQPAPEQLALEPTPAEQKLEYVGEVFKTYIITQRGDELCLIDKHAAHERQLYEKLAAGYGQVASQLMLVPVAVELSAEEKQAVLENIPLLENAGLEVGDFGGNTVLLRAVPADVEPDSAEDLLVELAGKLAQGSRDALSERTEWVLHSIACRAAIKAGDTSSPQELMALAEEILSGRVPPFCPHGRPCVLKLTRKELEKQFGRIV